MRCFSNKDFYMRTVVFDSLTVNCCNNICYLFVDITFTNTVPTFMYLVAEARTVMEMELIFPFG